MEPPDSLIGEREPRPGSAAIAFNAFAFASVSTALVEIAAGNGGADALANLANEGTINVAAIASADGVTAATGIAVAAGYVVSAVATGGGDAVASVSKAA